MIYPKKGEQIVLNGLLHPDSTIKISVSKSIPLEQEIRFESISNASVKIYENEHLLETPVFSDGYYLLNYFPKEGKSYDIKVDIPNYDQLRASDVMPTRPQVDMCFQEDTSNRYLSVDAYLNFTIFQSGEDRPNYWLDILAIGYDTYHCDSLVCDSANFFAEKNHYYQSFSTSFDTFNSFVNTTEGGVREYDAYIRIDQDAIVGNHISFDIASPNTYHYFLEYEESNNSFRHLVNIINASSTYDRYLKSSVIYYLDTRFGGEGVVSPFVEPTRIYSNIENGTGIFAAYNSVSINIGDFPCE